MKKLFVLGGLIAASAMQAQPVGKTIYYWPNERVTEITSGTQYFIYNAAYDLGSTPNDRGSFLYANGNSNFGTLNPKQYANAFTTSNAAYLFQIYKKAGTENVYQIKNSSNSWINFTGAATANAVDFYIKPWATSDAQKGNLQAKMDNGTLSSNLNSAKVWTVTNNSSNSSAWNGNGGFTTWNTAHPYAFYTVASKEISNQTLNNYQEVTNRTGLISDVAFKLQQIYGLVKDGSKLYSNYPETNASENSAYANLIDGNDNSIFHSSWSASGGADDPKHYLRAELETPQSSFYLITKRRVNNNNNRPTSILIEGSNEAEGSYTAITTLTGLPTAENEYFYFSDKISTTSYKYIRFTPLTNNSNTRYFTYSEFYLIGANTETDAAISKIKAFYGSRNLSVKDADFETNVLNGYTSVKNVQTTLNLNLYRTEAQALLKANESNHATDPALGQYPTEAYQTFKAAVENPAITGDELAAAVQTFKFSINAPVFTINGIFAGAYTTTGYSIYYKAGDATPLWWNKETNKYDRTMLWKFAGLTSNTVETGKTYSVMNLSDNIYFWNTDSLTVSQTSPENQNNIVLLKTKGNGTPVHADRNGSIVRWNSTASNSASAWTLTYVGESKDIDQIEREQLASYATLKTLISECQPYRTLIGNGLNQYSCIGHNFTEALRAGEELLAQDIYEHSDLNIAPVKDELQAAKNALTLNQPETGKFYRFRSAVQNNYIAANGSGDKPLMTANAQEAVFYLTADMRLITGSLRAMDNYNTVADLGKATTFKASNAKTGCYTIRNNNGTYFARTTGQNLDRHSDETTGLNTPECAWFIEEVTDAAQQPKLTKIMNAEYATLAAPVALNIPEGIKAYTVTVDATKQKAVMEEVRNTIPAGVAVVLKKEGTESSFDFLFAAEGETTLTNNLTGVYSATNISTDINAYILANGNNGIGFYQMKADDRTLGANKAYLTLPASASGIRSITIGGPTTGIESSIAEGTQPEEYYDLQGRRVLNPTKGIYVTKSGQKVAY